MKVLGKGAKERIVPLGKLSQTLLARYFAMCPYDNKRFVFCDIHGRQISGNAIRLFTYDLQSRLPFEFSSHKLRHNFATNFCTDNLRACGSSNVYDLSILMGHESIETTKKYEHFAHELIAVEKSRSHLDGIDFNGSIFTY